MLQVIFNLTDTVVNVEEARPNVAKDLLSVREVIKNVSDTSLQSDKKTL